MTENLLHRASPADLEVRSDGRTIVGIAVPFDAPTQVRDGHGPTYTEVFRRGAFARTIRERGDKVKLLTNHDAHSRLPIGRATLLREDASGLYGEFRVSQTQAGDEALTLIRDGALDGLSVGFRPLRDGRGDGGLVERLEVMLREVSAVAFPAYTQAAITAVRADGRPHPITQEAARARLDILRRKAIR